MLVSDDGLERSRQAAGDIVQGKAGRVGLINHLIGDEGHVNEAAAALREFFGNRIKHAIHEVIADEGSGGIGNGCGKILGLDAFDHGFDRQGGEIGVSAIGKDRLVDRLLSFVVRNTGIIKIDRHTFRSQLKATTGLAHAEHGIRFMLSHGFLHRFNRLMENGRHFKLNQLSRKVFRFNKFDGFQSRIDFFTPEGIKGCEQNFHDDIPP